MIDTLYSTLISDLNMITKNLRITLFCSIILVDTCLPASVLNVQPVQSIIKTSLEKNDKEVINNRNGKMLGNNICTIKNFFN